MDIEGAPDTISSAETAVKPAKVVVTDVDISFGNLVGLLVKLVFAAIPAAIILFFVGAVIVAIFGRMR